MCSIHISKPTKSYSDANKGKGVGVKIATVHTRTPYTPHMPCTHVYFLYPEYAPHATQVYTHMPNMYLTCHHVPTCPIYTPYQTHIWAHVCPKRTPHASGVHGSGLRLSVVSMCFTLKQHLQPLSWEPLPPPCQPRRRVAAMGPSLYANARPQLTLSFLFSLIDCFPCLLGLREPELGIQKGAPPHRLAPSRGAPGTFNLVTFPSTHWE